MIAVLAFFVWRWRKGLIKLEEDDDFSGNVIRTVVPSQITNDGGSFA
jgi:hypothetical protein